MKIVQIIDYKTFGDSFIDVAKSVVDDADLLWFRIKNLPANEIYNRAMQLRMALPDTAMVLSDRADIAKMAAFQGVHLGESTIQPEALRESFPELLLGYSAHSLDEIKSVDADYFTLSPLFHTEKDYEVKPIGVVDVNGLGKNIFALGGISPDNVSELKGKGYIGVAGISFHKSISQLKASISTNTE